MKTMIRVVLAIVIGSVLVSATQITKVVPVDEQTTAKLSQLKSAAEQAQKAYDDAMTEAKRRLLTTRDKAKGRCEAFREGDTSPLFGSGLLIPSGSLYGYPSASLTLRADGTVGWDDPNCPRDPTEKAKRDAKSRILAYEQAKADAKAKIERDQWESAHPQRYWLDGFCNDAVFTDDFKYLVPKEVEYKPSQYPWIMSSPASGTGTVNSGTFN